MDALLRCEFLDANIRHRWVATSARAKQHTEIHKWLDREPGTFLCHALHPQPRRFLTIHHHCASQGLNENQKMPYLQKAEPANIWVSVCSCRVGAFYEVMLMGYRNEVLLLHTSSQCMSSLRPPEPVLRSETGELDRLSRPDTSCSHTLRNRMHFKRSHILWIHVLDNIKAHTRC